jgi:cytochrome P450
MLLQPLFWRCANEDTSLGGYAVSRGAVVVASAAVLGRDRRQWGDDVDQFRPSRFLGDDNDDDNNDSEAHAPGGGGDGGPAAERHPFSYLPFGAGERACLGGRIAMVQVPVIVALILRAAAQKQASR